MLVGRKQPFRMMSSTVQLCKFAGLWDEKNQRKAPWQAVFIAFSLIFWYILPSVAFIIRNEKNITFQLKPILELFAMNVFTVRLLVHLLYRETLQLCYHEMQHVFSDFEDNPDEDVRSILKHLLKSADWLTKYYTCGVMLQASIYGWVPAILTIIRYMISADPPELPSTVLEADFIFFDHKSNFWMWLPSMITSLIVQYMMLTAMSANECLLWNLLHHVSCAFKIIGMEISKLNQWKDPVQWRRKFAVIVENHEVCYRSVRHLENALRPVMAILYCSCVLQTCYIMFVVSMVKDYILIGSMVFVLNYTIFMIFSFSMLGTELMDASASVSNAIYNTCWYERSDVERRSLLFMQMRSQREATISAAKFFYITRGTFAGAMKSAFSYFTIMQQFYGEN
ncbi:odorant receptor 49b-like [Topomyia yanbarensis]|uniref:odorant receptor 49b-like n=1 Tax=Topomyia yanbarensis TaxID=2498891 RepID=UPI00273AD3D4|nr:odorant receptor 49b-like [Topomyia yanbarensis]